MLIELAGIPENEHALALSGGRKKNSFVKYCGEQYETVASQLKGDSGEAVDPCEIFKELGRSWQELKLAERDQLLRNGLASLSEAFGWQGCAIM